MHNSTRIWSHWQLGMAFLVILSAKLPMAAAVEDEQWITFRGGDGVGNGKQIVLISGDEEYRSEEALPQLAKILSGTHGFHCTVLFAIDPKTGLINPDIGNNIPGLEALKTADLMIIATRFRNLPDDQMQLIVDYIESGRPVIGMRTATHAFNIPGGKAFSKYSWNTDDKTYVQGFGRQVLGETWISHYGHHKVAKYTRTDRERPGTEPDPERHQGWRRRGRLTFTKCDCHYRVIVRLWSSDRCSKE